MSLGDAFRRVEPGATAPPPPAALKTWTSQTTYGLLGGLLFGGYRGLLQARNKHLPSPVPTTSARHRLATFFVQESIITGARVGVFVSLFSAAALGAEALLGQRAMENYAVAGGVTCGLFGGAVGGGLGCGMGGGFGAIAGGTLGALQDELEKRAVVEVVEVQEWKVGDVVKGVEDRLNAHPLREGKE